MNSKKNYTRFFAFLLCIILVLQTITLNTSNFWADDLTSEELLETNLEEPTSNETEALDTEALDTEALDTEALDTEALDTEALDPETSETDLPEVKTITDFLNFDELSDIPYQTMSILNTTREGIIFPSELSVIVNDESLSIPVTWTTQEDFSDLTILEYIFTAQIPSEYSILSGLKIPFIQVEVTDNLAARESGTGYHDWNTAQSANIYYFSYDPNNGSSSFEKEKNGRTESNAIISTHIFDNASTYDGIPVYDETNFFDGVGIAGIDYIINNLKLSLNIFDRAYYDFVGWNTNPDGSGTPYSNGQPIFNATTMNLKTIKLYAQWAKANSSLILNVDTGIWSIDEFLTANNYTSNMYVKNGNITTVTLADGSKLEVKENGFGLITITGNCLSTIIIPKPENIDKSVSFVAWEKTNATNFDPVSNTFTFGEKNIVSSLTAKYLSALTLYGTVNLNGWNGKSGVQLIWGTIAEDNTEKVYKIAQSLDNGTTWEYVPDQNYTELVSGMEFNYTGDVQTFTAPVAGKYFIESYGANGGIGFETNMNVGLGGYSAGYVELEAGQTIYIYVGEAGGTYSVNKTYGGGGASPVRNKIWYESMSAWTVHARGRGGGATYISLKNEPLNTYIPSNYTSLSAADLKTAESQAVAAAKANVLLVAGGGGGAGELGPGGAGGGLIGNGSIVSNYTYGTISQWIATGGTQTDGGTGTTGHINGKLSDTWYVQSTEGTFFYGAGSLTCTGSGGGGWFGGGIGYTAGGGGGSSYTGGVQAGVTETGGNIRNLGDTTNDYYTNGKAIITICEAYVVTNTAENVYAPDEIAPTTPSNISSSLNTDKTKSNISWNGSQDLGPTYSFRIDAFNALNYEELISSSAVSTFDVITGLKGYLYVIDEDPDTICTELNSTLTTSTTLQDVDSLDLGVAKYIHIASVDNVGNVGNTISKQINKTTVVIDPDGKGSYDNLKNPTTLIADVGSKITLNAITADEKQTFMNWKLTLGDSTIENNTLTVGLSKTIVKANYVSDLILTSTLNYISNNGHGSVDLSWLQEDEIIKKYKLYQSLDGTNWYEANYDSSDIDDTTHNFAFNSNKAYETYTVPYNGTYTLTVNGAKGADAGTYTGGLGGMVSGNFELKKGDVLYIYSGGIGTNGGGIGSSGKNGGGATDIRLNGTDLSNRIIVAGGGGAGISGPITTLGKNGEAGGLNITNNNVLGIGSSNATGSGGGGGYYGGIAGTEVITQEIAPYENSSITLALKYTGPYGGYHQYLFSYLNAGGGTTSFVWYTASATSQTAIFNRLGSTGNTYRAYYSRTRGQVYTNTGDLLQGVDFAAYEFKPKYAYTPATGGTNYFDTAKGNLITSQSGKNNANGSAIISISQIATGSLTESTALGIKANDNASPDAPTGGYSNGFTKDTITLGWNIPKDNGTTYYHKVESYKTQEDVVLKTSNIVTDVLTTGIAGYRYYIDSSETGTVTLNNSSEILVNQLTISKNDITKYIHLAAFDKAGNLSQTYTFQASKSTILVDLIWEDGSNTNNTRPNTVVLGVYRDGSSTPIATQIISDLTDDTLVTTFTGLDTINPATGTPYVYTLQASGISSNNEYFEYDTTYDGSGFVVTNTLDELYKDITISVNWNDNNNLYISRPTTVLVDVYKDGILYKTLTLDGASNTWSKILLKVPAKENEQLVNYTVKIKPFTSMNGINVYETSYATESLSINNNLKYTLTIDPNGGLYEGSTSKNTNLFLENFQKIVTRPTRNGYVFAGWTLVSGNANIGASFITTKNENTEVRASWTKKLYTLTINPNGGTWNGFTTEQTLSLGYQTKKLIEIPEKIGATFVRWELTGNESSLESMTSESPFTMGIENATLKAIWKNNKYAFTVNPNGGIWNGFTSPQHYVLEYASNMDVLYPTKTGYSFVNWTLQGQGSTITYAAGITPGSEITDPTAPTENTEDSAYIFTMGQSTSSITANWAINKHNVKINANGGTYNGKTGETNFYMNYNEIKELQNPIYSGHVFLGWELDSELSDATLLNTQDAYQLMMADSNITLTALWTETKTIEFSIQWEDRSNEYLSRPDEVYVDLYQNNLFLKTILVSGTSDTWLSSFEDILIYDEENEEYEYSIKQHQEPLLSENIDDTYITTYNGFEIINTLANNGEKIIEGSITWKDNNNKYGFRPNTYEILLFRNEVLIDKIVAKQSDTSYAFEELDKYDDELNLYEYTIEETLNESYTYEVLDFNITNIFNGKTPNHIPFTKNTRVKFTMTFDSKVDFVNLELDKKDVTMKLNLKLMNQSFVETSIPGTYEVTYLNTYQGYEINADLNANKISKINYLPVGKYEINVTGLNYFELDSILLTNSDNEVFVKEAGKYYVIVSNGPAISKSQFNVKMTSNNWKGYADELSLSNSFK